jgi:predicted nucleic acid-binding protein
MRILLDTNIVLDLLLEREPFFTSSKDIFTLVELKKIDGFLCATTITTLHYLISKKLHKKQTDTVLKSLLEIFDITNVDKDILKKSIKENGSDFEDSVIYTSALYSKVDFIITRDEKGFKNSQVSVLSPKEFLASLKGLNFDSK